MNSNFNRYDGRVAIVTGGADGIGKAISIRLAIEGAKVCLFDSDRDGFVLLNVSLEGATVE